MDWPAYRKTGIITLDSVSNCKHTINGVNDTATITGNATALVAEDESNPNLTATGNLTATDVDAGSKPIQYHRHPRHREPR